MNLFNTKNDQSDAERKELEDFKKSYKNDVIIESQNECNNTCTDSEYEAMLEANFISWLIKQNTGFKYYKGSLQSDNTYTWVKII